MDENGGKTIENHGKTMVFAWFWHGFPLEISEKVSFLQGDEATAERAAWGHFSWDDLSSDCAAGAYSLEMI